MSKIFRIYQTVKHVPIATFVPHESSQEHVHVRSCIQYDHNQRKDPHTEKKVPKKRLTHREKDADQTELV